MAEGTPGVPFCCLLLLQPARCKRQSSHLGLGFAWDLDLGMIRP